MNIRSVDELITEHNEGQSFKYVYFWGHTPKQQDQVDKSCFSNWFPAEFTVDDNNYATAEHYMMAEKARLFGDEENRQKILQCRTPGEAKKLGRMVKNFDEGVWKEHRFQIVVDGCYAKFKQNSALGEFLLRTGERIIVEASPYDRIWGIGLTTSNEKALDPNKWRGLNLLGFALMEVRQKIRDTQN